MGIKSYRILWYSVEVMEVLRSWENKVFPNYDTTSSRLDNWYDIFIVHCGVLFLSDVMRTMQPEKLCCWLILPRTFLQKSEGSNYSGFWANLRQVSMFLLVSFFLTTFPRISFLSSAFLVVELWNTDFNKSERGLQIPGYWFGILCRFLDNFLKCFWNGFGFLSHSQEDSGLS